jgi:hypothetical protein
MIVVTRICYLCQILCGITFKVNIIKNFKNIKYYNQLIIIMYFTCEMKLNVYTIVIKDITFEINISNLNLK